MLTQHGEQQGVSPTSSVTSCSTPGSILSQTLKPLKPLKPLRAEDCLKKMVESVKSHNLEAIGRGMTNEELEAELRPQAEIAANLPLNLAYVTRELAMNLAILSLYDLAVLIGESPDTC